VLDTTKKLCSILINREAPKDGHRGKEETIVMNLKEGITAKKKLS